mmetsp:Transcript_49032/g.98287  ORF Transcript_49032/g.98287 Transcript_49032/m.98287 type:complete len:312 (+) Transcript_49032:192-1127(+)
MGGVLASLELGLGTNEVRSAETMAPALVRIGLMGGATMIAANVLGAWSCIEGASGVADATWLPLGETYHSPHDPECLRNYCVQTNVIWACVSAITGLLLSGAGLMRSKTLLVFFFAALAARVCFIVMEFVLATGAVLIRTAHKSSLQPSHNHLPLRHQHHALTASSTSHQALTHPIFVCFSPAAHAPSSNISLSVLLLLLGSDSRALPPHLPRCRPVDVVCDRRPVGVLCSGCEPLLCDPEESRNRARRSSACPRQRRLGSGGRERRSSREAGVQVAGGGKTSDAGAHARGGTRRGAVGRGETGERRERGW